MVRLLQIKFIFFALQVLCLYASVWFVKESWEAEAKCVVMFQRFSVVFILESVFLSCSI